MRVPERFESEGDSRLCWAQFLSQTLAPTARTWRETAVVRYPKSWKGKGKGQLALL